MAIPSTMSDLFVARDSNSPAGSEAVFPNNDEFLRIMQAILRRSQAISAATLASSATVSIGGSTDGDIINISGTSTITSFGTGTAGIIRVLKFTGAASISHSSNILIGQSVKCAAGDVMAFMSEGGSVWRCIYRPQNQVCTLSGSGTYTSGGNLAQDGNIILCDFVSANTTTACTLDGVAIRGLTGAAGIDNVTGGLTGIQRLKYNSANTCWIAIDQTSHFITTTLAADVVLPVNHTNIYDASSSSSLLLRVARTGSNKEEYRIVCNDISTAASTRLYLYPDGVASNGASYAGSCGIECGAGVVRTSQSSTEGAALLTSHYQAGNSLSVDSRVMLAGIIIYCNGSYRTSVSFLEAGNIYSNSQANTGTLTRLGAVVPASSTMSGRVTVTRLS
jgi:hypothetical protein